MTTYIGIIAAILTTVSFIPQVIKTVKTKNTRDISLSFSVAFTTGVFLWLVYGLSLRDPAIILANSITIVLSLVILGFKLKYK